MKLLEYAIRTFPSTQLPSVLDVGTGSGILGIAARKLGASPVLGVDNDPVAVEVSSENILLNQVDNMTVSTTPIGELRGKYGLIVANILLATHQELIKDYTRLIQPGGCLILSGLLAENSADVADLLKRNQWRADVWESAQDWVAVLAVCQSK